MHSQHHRYAIWSSVQHPYKHSLNEFAYSNPAMPGVTNVESALSWILAVLYPQVQTAVATVAALPASSNTLNDYRVVTDDGDGKAAAYRWELREGEVSASWHKIYDMDWGVDSILTQLHQQSLSIYMLKQGNDDLDAAGAAITGTYAGQRLFGGATASNNLTLTANSADGTGAHTGYVQMDSQVRPTSNNAYDLGTSALKFRTAYLGTSAIIAADLTLASGSITSASGAISFDNENLSTTGNFSGAIVTGTTSLKASSGGTLMTISAGAIASASGAIAFGSANFTGVGTIASGAITISSTLTLGSGSIVDSGGTISFSTNTLTASTFTGTTVNGGNLRLAANALTSTNTDGNIAITPNGAGTITLSAAATTQGIAATGAISASTTVTGGNVRLSGNAVITTNTNGDLSLTPNGSGAVISTPIFKPGSDNAITLGTTGARWSTLYVGTSIGDGTNAILASELLSLRNVKFRDSARSQAVQTGDALFYDSSSGTWLASAPDTEITHSALSGLTTSDAGHTQFVLLTGRSGGQTVQGGTAGGEHLLLESTANASKGLIKAKDALVPNTTAAYSSGWTGTNLGGTSNTWNNFYISGEVIGLRPENLATASISTSAQKVGRMYWDTDLSMLKVDTGAAIKTIVDLNSTQTITGKSISASQVNSGTLAVAQGGTNLASGTSGGVLYYSASGTLASSGALAQYCVVLGGGAGATPATLATDSSTNKWLRSGGSSANPSWVTPLAQWNYTAQTGTYSAVIGDCVDATSGTFTITLPTAVSVGGQSIRIINTGTGVLTIATTSSQTIQGLASAVIKMGTAGDSITVVSDGANWKIAQWNILVAARYTTTAGQAMADATLATVDFGTKIHDGWSMVATGTWLCTIPVPGIYAVSVSVCFQTAMTTDTGYAELHIQKDSADYTVHTYSIQRQASGEGSYTLTSHIQCIAGSTIRFRLYQSNGASRSLTTAATQNQISISLVGGAL